MSQRIPRNLIYADAIVDYRGVLASPGAIFIEGETLVDAGTPEAIGSIEGVSVTQINGVVTPSFVNTHSHLDLSGVGNEPPRDSFIDWFFEVIKPIRLDADGIQAAVHKGIDLSLKGGCRIVGDIAGTQLAAEIVESSDLLPVSFIELFGLGEKQEAAIETLQLIPETFEVSPHAPYSCGKELYQASFRSGKKVATHLSESLSEIEYTKFQTGEFDSVLKLLGAWDETIEPWGGHPIDALLAVADGVPFLAAHVNYIEEHHLQMLADSNITVAYCPRASEYFGHCEHRYISMLDAGVRVSLGTDSLLCLDTPDRISVIDDLRYLYKRDHTDPLQLLTMGTVNGAIGLGLHPNLVTLDPGETAGLLVFESIVGDPIADIMKSEKMPDWLF